MPVRTVVSSSLSLSEKIVFTIILSIITVIGILGNLLICMIFPYRQRIKHMHISSRYLIINLGFVDMLISMNNILYILNLNGIDLTSNHRVCQWSGFANIGLVLVSIWLIVMISANRAAIITNRSHYFTKKKTIVYIAVDWVISLAIGVAPILGWSKYYYQEHRLICTVVFLNPRSFSITYFLIFELLPAILIVYCTIVILKLKRQNLRRVIALDVSNRSARLMQDARQTVMLLVVIFIFGLCFLPDFVMKRAKLGNNVPAVLFALSTTLRLLNHAINPIIYGFMNKDFKISLFQIAKALFMPKL